MSVGPIENHRRREKGVLVYPVYSRRTGGLSVGINLFPEKKICSFDCPYCEVFPFRTEAPFSVNQMEDDLGAAIIDANERGIPVKDICFSGNGEPTMSDDLGPALEIAGRVRDQMAAEAALVLITNGTGLLQGDTFNLLKDATKPPLSLDIWLKLDAGTLEWYEKMSRSDIPFETLIEKIRVFASGSPITLQTMLCAIDGEAPPKEEALALENYITRIALDTREHASKGALLRKVQIYGKARPAPEDPKASALPAEYLEERAASLRRALEEAGLPQGAPPVEVYP